MLDIIRTAQFKKDVKRINRRNFDIEKLKEVLGFLVNELELPQKYKNHNLVGNYHGRKECHIEPDWLLIYRIQENYLYLERTGTHSDLF
jgi:mRNA interferase YafQ